MHEINRAANLKEELPYASIFSCERVVSSDNVGLQVTSGTIVQNQKHLPPPHDKEVFVEGDDIWVRGDESVVIYLPCCLVESVVDVVGGWDARWVWVGDVDDFHSATNVCIGPAGQLEVNDPIHGAKSASADTTLDKVPVSHHASDEGGVGVGSGRAIRRSCKGHGETGQAVPRKCCGIVCDLYDRCVSAETC